MSLDSHLVVSHVVVTATVSGRHDGCRGTVPAIRPLAAPASRLAPDALLAGRYRIAAFLGRGAVGEVYEAFDQELGDAIAIKILRPEIARDERALQRFKREIQLARRVTHPNVCRVFDLVHHTGSTTSQTGDSSPGQAFLTMELLRGETLEQLIKRTGRLEVKLALEIATQVAAGLAAVHEQNLVHRDIKPTNIMVSLKEEGSVTAKIIDLGLAKTLDESASEAGISSPGAFAGTPDRKSVV